MSRIHHSRIPAWAVLALLAIATLALLAAVPRVGAAVSPSATDPAQVSISSGPDLLKVLEYADLTTAGSNLSGLYANAFEMGYTSSSEDLLGPSATVYYKTDGSRPTTSPSIAITGSGSTVQSDRVFAGTFTTAQLAGGHTMVFIVQLRNSAGSTLACDYGVLPGQNRVQPGTCANPAPVGAGFRYRIDLTRPTSQTSVLANITHAAGGVSYVGEPRAGIEVVFRDPTPGGTAYNSQVDPDSVEVAVHQGASRLVAYDADADAGQNHLFNVTRTANETVVRLERDRFDWPANANLSLSAQASDHAANPYILASPFVFQVDTRAPLLDAPFIQSVEPSRNVDEDVDGTTVSRTITGLGALVRVRAEFRDPNVDASPQNRTAVVARIVAATGGPFTSDPVGLAYVQTIGGKQRFEGNVRIFNSSVTPDFAFTFFARVDALDRFGNNMTRDSPEHFIEVRPGAPEITILPVQDAVSGVVGAGPYLIEAKVDAGEYGVDADTVTLYVRAKGMTFLANDGWAADPSEPNLYYASMEPSGTRFRHEVPAASDGAAFTVRVAAADTVGNLNFSEPLVLHADRKGPVVTEPQAKAWRGGPPLAFKFTAEDRPGANASAPVAGVDTTSAKGFARAKGDTKYGAIALAYEDGAFAAAITESLPHRLQLEYYVEVRDQVGNKGSLGSATDPLTFRIDRRPPTVELVETPAVSETGAFRLEAEVSDTDSGVDRVVFEVRTGTSGSEGEWAVLQNWTVAYIEEVCLQGGASYEFRVRAVDRAGNAAEGATNAVTRVDGEGCRQEITVEVLEPARAEGIDVLANGTYRIRYDAHAETATATSGLIIRIQFSPDDGATYIPIAEDLHNTGSYLWDLSSTTNCDRCRLRVEATLPGGGAAFATSEPFRILGASGESDLDGDAIPDACELAAFGELVSAHQGGDADGDGLPDELECELGLSPADEDTDDDEAPDGVEVDLGTDPLEPLSTPSKAEQRYTQWRPYYVAVPALFIAVTLVYLFGTLRRW